MNIWKQLWADEHGFILTAEAVLLTTVGVVGATTGLTMAVKSVDEEMHEAAESFRSLDQSYYFHGHSSCSAATAGSCYEQPPIEQSLQELRDARKNGTVPRHHQPRNVPTLRKKPIKSHKPAVHNEQQPANRSI